MGQIGTTIAAPAGLCIMYAEKVLEGVTPEMFHKRPTGADGKPVMTSHPAFIMGHLSIYPARLLPALGLDLGPAKNPDRFEDLFSAKEQCKDDPDAKLYPSMEAITSHFFNGHRHLIAHLPEVSDEVFQGPNPVEQMRDRFPTLGNMTAFMMLSHTMMHLGQISTWRRCMGLGAAM